MSDEEFIEGLRKQKPIYPVIVKKGDRFTVIDGKHRIKANPSWPILEVEAPTKKDEIIIRLRANYRRQVPQRETDVELMLLASYLEDDGVPAQKVASELAKITPYSQKYIEKRLPKKYKGPQGPKPQINTPKRISEIRKPEPTVSIAPPPPSSVSDRHSPHFTVEVGGAEKQVETERGRHVEEYYGVKQEKPPVFILLCPHCDHDISSIICPKCKRLVDLGEIL